MSNDNPTPIKPEESLKHDEQLLLAATNAVNALLAETDSSAGIARALALIGQAAEVDRIYVFENHIDVKTGVPLASQRYEWTRECIAPQIANPALQNMEYLPVFKRWRETLSFGKPIFGLIRDFPEPEKRIMESQGIISILTVPIKTHENLWGFIGLDDCRRERSWTPTEIAILTTIASSIGYIMIQKHTEDTLRRFQAALDGAGDAIGMADMQGHHFYQNAAFTELFGYQLEELGMIEGPSILYRDQDIAKEVFKRILTGGSWHGELEMRSKSGRIISVFLRADAIKEGDKPFAVMGIHTDITKRKETDKALRESELRYRRLIEAITDYIYTVKVENGQVISTSHAPNCLSVTGYASDEFQIDLNLWINMVHADDRQKVLQQAQHILNGDTIQPIEHRIYHKNGQIRWVRNTPVPHYDSGGKLISYDGLVYDVTDRKNAEEQLQAHVSQLEILNRIIMAVNRADNQNMLLNEALKASMQMILFDSGGIYLVNPNNSTAELVCNQGLSEEFIRNAGVLTMSAANCRMLFIEGKPIFTDNYSLISSDPAANWNVQSIARIPLVSKDIVIGALALVNAKGHTFNENEKELLLSIGRQIGTAIVKMRSETALRESERKYRTITEQSLVGIHIIKDAVMIFVNEGWTKITGYNIEDVKLWSVVEYLKIVHPEDRSLFMQDHRRKQLGHTDDILSIYDCRFLSKTGEIKWVSTHSRAVEFADGRAIVAMLIDITDRKLATAALVDANKQLTKINEHLTHREQELMKANSEKEVLLKEIHHRVKNNLQIITSLINLQIHNITDRNAVGLLKECQSRIKTIAMVHEKIYQIGDLAHVEIGDYMDSLTRQMIHMYQTDPLSVAIKISAREIFLPIDQAIPCALLVNELVSNSLKHAFPEHKNGEINIAMSLDEGGSYVLKVSDNGIGLPTGLDYQKTKSLGMQLVNTFVSQLQGTIEIQNRNGTTFTIKFAQSKKS